MLLGEFFVMNIFKIKLRCAQEMASHTHTKQATPSKLDHKTDFRGVDWRHWTLTRQYCTVTLLYYSSITQTFHAYTQTT